MTHLTRALAVLIGIVGAATMLSAQHVDQDWLARWNQAQTHRPAALASHSRIAPAAEPGTPLIIEGRIFGPDGVTPQANAVVFAYHTADDGRYSTPEQPEQPWRLQGWATTDASGRFEFATIRPAPYPNHKVPAHVHLTIETTSWGRQYGGLQFADDELVSATDREKSTADGKFGGVLAVTRDGSTQRVHLNIKLKPKGDF